MCHAENDNSAHEEFLTDNLILPYLYTNPACSLLCTVTFQRPEHAEPGKTWLRLLQEMQADM